MNSTGVNVETPIFSRDTFASTLGSQSAKVFSRLVHTPLISLHLINGALTGAEIDRTATTRIKNLEELEKLLTALQKCQELQRSISISDATGRTSSRANSKTTPARAAASPSDVALPNILPASPALRSGEERHSCCQDDGGNREGDDGSPAVAKVPAESFFVPLASFFFRAGEHAAAEKGQPTNAASGGHPPPHVAAAPPPPTAANVNRNVTLGEKQVRLPKGVVEAFNISGALGAIPPHRIDCPHATTATTRSTVPFIEGGSPPASTSVAAAIRSSTAEVTAEGAHTAGADRMESPAAVPLTEDQRAASVIVHLKGSHMVAAVKGGDSTNSAAPAEEPPLERFLCSANDAANDSIDAHGGKAPATRGDWRTDSAVVENGESARGGHGPDARSCATAAPSPTDRAREEWLPDAHGVGDLGGGLTAKEARRAEENDFMASSSSSLSPRESHRTSPDVAEGANATRTQPSDRAADAALPRLPARSSSPASPSAAVSPQRRQASHAQTSAPPDAYALCHPDYEDLAGWLNILVWTRLEVIFLLRELSSVQALAARSAWYWAWAQDSPCQATFHFALGSTQFWRSAIRGDFRSPVALVHFTASGHMMALRSLFRLIVSCVGAAHSALESLNSVVAEIQREAEVTTSDVAAAAAAMRTSKAVGPRQHQQHFSAAAVGTAAALFGAHHGGAPPPLEAAVMGGDGAAPFAAASAANANGTSFSYFGAASSSPPGVPPTSLAASMRYASLQSFRPPLAAPHSSFASPPWSPKAMPAVTTTTTTPTLSKQQGRGGGGGTRSGEQHSLARPASCTDVAAAASTADPAAPAPDRAAAAAAPPSFLRSNPSAAATWETYSNSTLDGNVPAAAWEMAGGVLSAWPVDELGPPPCQAYNVVEAVRSAVLTTVTRVSAMVGAQGLPSQIAQEAREKGEGWEAANLPWQQQPQRQRRPEKEGGGDPFGENAQGSAKGSRRRPKHRSGISALALEEGFTAGGIQGLTESMEAAAAGHHGGSAGDLASPQLRLGEFHNARKATLAEGVEALRLCVSRTRFFLQTMVGLLERVHRPPSTRHWQRVAMAACTVIPAFTWLYTKSPADLERLGKAAFTGVWQMLQTYVVLPAQQLREAVFYVRPGVMERRTSFDRDAQALANIVRDYHEDYFPGITQAELDRLRDYSLDCMRRGVADDKGFGLIEQHYRSAVKHPIRTAVFGDLPRILLIQMSYQALELSRVTNGMDEVLQGNDLNFKVMALMPVFAVMGIAALWTMMKWRAAMLPVQQRMKLIWRAIYRVVTLAESEEAAAGIRGGGQRHDRPRLTYEQSPRAPPPQRSFHRYSSHMISRAAGQQLGPASHGRRAHESRGARRHREQEATHTGEDSLRNAVSEHSSARGHASGARRQRDAVYLPIGSDESASSPDPGLRGHAGPGTGVTNASIATAAYGYEASDRGRGIAATTAQAATRSNAPRLGKKEEKAKHRRHSSHYGGGARKRPPALQLALPIPEDAADESDRNGRARKVRGGEPANDSEAEAEAEEAESKGMSFSESENEYTAGGLSPNLRRECFSSYSTAPYPNEYNSDRRMAEPSSALPFVDTTPITAVGLETVSSARALNNYEQGMVLVLVHLMRSLTKEYLKSYAFYHELMEDLDDLESMQCSRHQRLETLRRMNHTHSFLR